MMKARAVRAVDRTRRSSGWAVRPAEPLRHRRGAAGRRRRERRSASRRHSDRAGDHHVVDRHETVLMPPDSGRVRRHRWMTGTNSSPSGRSLPRMMASTSPSRSRSTRPCRRPNARRSRDRSIARRARRRGSPNAWTPAVRRSPRQGGRGPTCRWSGCRHVRRCVCLRDRRAGDFAGCVRDQAATLKPGGDDHGQQHHGAVVGDGLQARDDGELTEVVGLIPNHRREGLVHRFDFREVAGAEPDRSALRS